MIFVTFNLLTVLTVTIAISFSPSVSAVSNFARSSDLQNQLKQINLGNRFSTGSHFAREENDEELSFLSAVEEYQDEEDGEFESTMGNCSSTARAIVGNGANATTMQSERRRMNSISLKGGESGSSKKRKVLILMSDTGGGHRASAQAIDQVISIYLFHAVSCPILSFVVYINKVMPIYNHNFQTSSISNIQCCPRHCRRFTLEKLMLTS